MLVSWDNTMSVGDEQIDKQHQTLITKINELHQAASQGKASTLLLEMLEFLVKYAMEHFSAEEKYFVSKFFPEADQHKQLHRQFEVKVADTIDKVSKEGVSSVVVIDISNFLANWITVHIKSVDKRYAHFIETGKMPN